MARGRRSGRTAEDFAATRRELERWRKRRSGRRIPEPLWSRAVELARRHGVHCTAKELRLDYKTVQHNIRVLEKNNFIERQGDGYGDIFFVTELISANLPTLYKVIRRVEERLDKKKKKYIE